VRSIDVGCAQINLMYHPSAFASVEQAFDPASNADYAARFLKELRDTTAGGNWMTAAGDYHSLTPELAEPYRQQVEAAMADGTLVPTPVHAL
jgi:soluble lytic murein transglycosylase-like protein